MPNKDKAHTTGEIQQLIKKINQTWLKGRPQELKAYFHPDIQFAGLNLEIMGSGRQVCIESYQDFVNKAAIIKYNQSDPDIQVWGYSALAKYKFSIEYEMNGKRLADSGFDLFLFTYSEGRWQAVWRMLISE